MGVWVAVAVAVAVGNVVGVGVDVAVGVTVEVAVEVGVGVAVTPLMFSARTTMPSAGTETVNVCPAGTEPIGGMTTPG